ncbi:hypothetical protein GC197_11720 [bacterium]|nr:hypothetical protein [bacterium]
MKRMLFSLALVLICTPLFGQGYVAPVYPAYGSYTNTATAAQGALQGLADVASAAGSYNLNTAQANVYQQQANSMAISNRQQFANTYYQMRAQHDAYEAQKHPTPTEEQLVALAQEDIPKSLPAGTYDPVSATLKWPEMLQYPDFEADRKAIETLLKQKSQAGSLGVQQSQQFASTIDNMAVILKRGISKVPPQKYMEAYDFLNRLLYTTCQTELPS